MTVVAMTVVAMTVVARFMSEYTEADLPEIKFNPDGVLGTTEEVLAALEKDPKKGVAIMTEASANRTTGAIACHLTPHHAAPSRVTPDSCSCCLRAVEQTRPTPLLSMVCR